MGGLVRISQFSDWKIHAKINFNLDPKIKVRRRKKIWLEISGKTCTVILTDEIKIVLSWK